VLDGGVGLGDVHAHWRARNGGGGQWRAAGRAAFGAGRAVATRCRLIVIRSCVQLNQHLCG
jgi:hypothetical protein